jgi:hypothetical protein
MVNLSDMANLSNLTHVLVITASRSPPPDGKVNAVGAF